MTLESFGRSKKKIFHNLSPPVHKSKNQIIFNAIEFWTSSSNSNTTQTQSTLNGS